MNTKVEVSEDYTSHVPHKELFMEIHENRIINSLLKINNVTPFAIFPVSASPKGRGYRFPETRMNEKRP